jgi:hypothetical protein
MSKMCINSLQEQSRVGCKTRGLAIEQNCTLILLHAAFTVQMPVMLQAISVYEMAVFRAYRIFLAEH